MKIISILMMPGLMALLMGCTAAPPILELNASDEDHGGGFVKYEIRLVPRNDGGITLPGNRNCDSVNGNKRGCVRFDEGTYGAIVFSVRGSGQSNESCSDNGVQWVITEIQITDEVDPGNPDKGTDWDEENADWLKNSLFPFYDKNSGLLYKADRDTGRTTVGILNRNDNSNNDPKEFWYKVITTKCRMENGVYPTAETDPKVENDGR